MADNSLPTNNTAETVDTVLNTTVSELTAAVETAAIGMYPFLGTPVFKQVWEWFFQKFVAIPLSVAGQKLSTNLVVSGQVASEVNALTAAENKLINDEKANNQTAIQQDLKDYVDAQSKLVNIDGVATPTE